MLRHSGSHGLAVFICMISSAFIVAMIRAFLPELLDTINQLSFWLCNSLSLPYPPKSIELIIIASFMGLIWGAGFYFLHRD